MTAESNNPSPTAPTSEELGRDLDARREACGAALDRLAALGKERAIAKRACADDMASTAKRDALSKLDAEIARLGTDHELLELRVADAEKAYSAALRAEKLAKLRALEAEADPHNILCLVRSMYVQPLVQASEAIWDAAEKMFAVCGEQRSAAAKAQELAKELGVTTVAWKVDPEAVRVAAQRCVKAGGVGPSAMTVAELVTPIHGAEIIPLGSQYRTLHPLLKDHEQFGEAGRYLSLMLDNERKDAR